MVFPQNCFLLTCKALFVEPQGIALYPAVCMEILLPFNYVLVHPRGALFYCCYGVQLPRAELMLPTDAGVNLVSTDGGEFRILYR